MIEIIVPGIPPSVNQYKRPMRRGLKIKFKVTDKAHSFKRDIATFLRGRFVDAEAFEVEATIYLGYRQKGDADNFLKVLIDGLAEAGAFRMAGERVSDAKVTDVIARVRRDRDNPRTVIRVSMAACVDE
jgi:Holliday junction resolvase RusA-like endonuclease